MTGVSECNLTPSDQFVSYNITWKEQVTRQREDDGHFVVDQQPYLHFYSASSQKQQIVGRHVAPIGHNILIRSHPFFTFTP